MNNKNIPIYLALAVVFGIFIGTFFNGKNSRLSIGKSSNEKKIKRLLYFIEQDYVDEVNTDNLLDNAIGTMLDKLDPHSVYIPKEKSQAITENMEGNFVGIGIQFRIIKDTITVIQPIKGGPSIKSGIKAGDRILLANNDTLFGKNITNNDVLKKLKGTPNSSVNLKLYRKTNDSIFNVTIKRSKINIKSVEIAYMLNDSIGYIKLNRFAKNTYQEFKSSLNKLKSKGMTDLVLDLRGNGGGFIHIANKIVDEFLEDKKLIVYTKDKKGNINKSFSTEKGSFEKGDLYVLIDENSASASEIVAGALQDNDKGTIIGRRSFGKGLVQQEMDLGDGSAVRLTTARYYTPTGRSIQKPYTTKLSGTNVLTSNAYRNEVFERYDNGELFSKDSIKVTDSLEFKTPKGKIVYGGGGIIPDIFVPLDTTKYINNGYYQYLNNFSFNYVDTHRKKLSKVTLNEFIQDFDPNNVISKKFFANFKNSSISKSSKKKLREYLKTLIARDFYGDEGYYKINLQNDKMIKKVFELETKDSLD